MLNLLRIVLYYFYRLLDLAILLYCIFSWFVRPGTRLYDIYVRMAYYLEPLFVPARKLLSRFRLNIPIDLSPWLTMILIGIIYRILATILYMF